MVRPVLSDRCPVLSVSPVCNVGVLWSNSWMDQDETWPAGRPRPRPHCVRWGPTSSTERGTTAPRSKFTGIGFAYVHIIHSPCLLRPNGSMDQDETWHDGTPWPSPNCVKWGPSSPPPKGHSPPILAHVCCGQTAGWIKMPLGTEVGLCPGNIVLDGGPSSPP